MNSDRRATSDIDAVLAPAELILQSAAALAVERGLPLDWLNNAVTAFVPPVGPDVWVEVIHEGDVSVSIATPDLLLAMKLEANRGRRDSDDIEYLLGVCGVTSLGDAEEIYERFHIQGVLSDAATARVQAWLDGRAHEAGPV